VDGRIVGCELEYESILIQEDGVSIRQAKPGIPVWLALRRSLASLRGLRVQQQGIGKFKVDAAPRIDLLPEGFAVVEKDSLVRSSVQSASAVRLNYTEATDLAATQVGGTVAVVPEYEEVAV